MGSSISIFQRHSHVTLEMTQAWVSPIVNWDSKSPTLLEVLFYWLASATSSSQRIAIPGAWAIPQVSAEAEGNIPRFPSSFRSVCLMPDGQLDRVALRALVSWP